MGKKFLLIVGVVYSLIFSVTSFADDGDEPLMIPVDTGSISFTLKDFDSTGEIKDRFIHIDCPDNKYKYPWVMAYRTEQQAALGTFIGIECLPPGSFIDIFSKNAYFSLKNNYCVIKPDSGCGINIIFQEIRQAYSPPLKVPAITSGYCSWQPDGILVISYVAYCSKKPILNKKDTSI